MLSLVPRLGPGRFRIPFKAKTVQAAVIAAIDPDIGDSNGDWDLDGSGTSPASVTLNTQAAGSDILAFTFGQFTNYSPPTYNGGSAMSLVHTSGYASGLWPGFGLELYSQLDVAGGSGHALSFAKPGSPTQESTLIGVEIQRGGVIKAQNVVARANAGANTPLSSGSVTTTAPALLVSVWGGDGGVGTVDQSAAPSSGWTMIESNFLGLTAYIQAACAVRKVSTPGTYTCDWTAVADQGAIISIVAIQLAPPRVVASVVTGSGSGTAVSAARDTSGATVLRAFVISQSATAPTLTDNLGNTWVPVGATTQFSTSFNGYMTQYATSGAITVGAGHQLTAVGSVATTVGMIAIKARAGGTLAVTTWDRLVDNTSPHAGNVQDPVQATALIVAVGAHDGTGNPVTYDWSGSSFVEQASEKNASSFWTASIATREVTDDTTFTPSFTSSGSPAGGIVAAFVVTES